MQHMLVCQNNYSNNTEQISMKFRWRMGLGPNWTPLTFEVDLDKGMDPGFCSLFLECFSILPLISQQIILKVRHIQAVTDDSKFRVTQGHQVSCNSSFILCYNDILYCILCYL